MKLRMKKMPRPLDLSMFSGASGIGDLGRLEPFALVGDLDDELGRGLDRA